MTAQYYQKSLEEMVQKLIKDEHVKGDIEKVRSIFMWLISRDVEKLSHDFHDPKPNTTVHHIIYMMKGGNHPANVFAEMCRLASRHVL